MTWSSSDTSVVRIDTSGVAIGASIGTANIGAAINGVRGQAVLTVIERDPRPNIIVIMTDDQRIDQLAFMPQLQHWLVQGGLSFGRFFVTTGTCCPSRASFLRGQYAHNHQTLNNLPPAGSFLHFRDLGNEASTLATWLQGAGYRTALFGKYLNRYPGYPNPDLTYVPPGWTDWFGVFTPTEGNPSYVDYYANDNGFVEFHGDGPGEYLTDVLSSKAITFIRQSQFLGEPFFLYVAPYAPHTPATPAPRDVGALSGVGVPRTPAFDEADVSDKWQGVQQLLPLTAEQVQSLDALYQAQLETLLSVDDMVNVIHLTLAETESLDNTYVFFTSDNGLEMGEHRLVSAKEVPYEETIRQPLIVWGPGVPAGGNVSSIALNIDVAPTIAELAGVPAPAFVDGRSLVSWLRGQTPPWRHAFAEEVWDETEVTSPRTSFEQIRTDDYSYTEFFDGERELYDLRVDPYELQNINAGAPSSLTNQLSTWLHELRGCQGASCRTLDVAP